MEAYDMLPDDIRQFLANHKQNIPATRIYQIWRQYSYDDAALWRWIRGLRILNQ